MNTIPQIIHLCWFGDKEMPESYEKNINKWIRLCSSTPWTVCLWQNLDFEFFSSYTMMQAAKAHPVQIANIFRLHALYKYGGIYVDIDIVPIRLPEFSKNDRPNLFTEIGGDGNTKFTNATIAAPKQSKHILDLYWWCLQNTNFSPERSLEQHLKAGASCFEYFDKQWFKGTVKREPCHFSPVPWTSARVLNIMEKIGYAGWSKLAESYSDTTDIYGVHTYDSSWVYDLNSNKLQGGNCVIDQSES